MMKFITSTRFELKELIKREKIKHYVRKSYSSKISFCFNAKNISFSATNFRLQQARGTQYNIEIRLRQVIFTLS